MNFDERLAARALNEIREAEQSLGAAALLFGSASTEFQWLKRIVQQLREMRANHVASQAGCSVDDDGWRWRPIDADTAFAPPFGTVRVCRACGSLVAGGPTACGRCVAQEEAKAVQP